MKTTRSLRSLRGAAAFALLALGLSASATAQDVITAHKLDISLKLVSQTDDSSGDLKQDKFTAKEQDVFEACVGRPPAKDEGVYLFLNCESLEDSVVLAIDTDPLTRLADVGTVHIEADDAVLTTKNDVLRSMLVPAELRIECDGADLEVQGNAKVDFTALDALTCPSKASAKVIGHGSEPDDFIVNDGSKVSAQKRAAAITVVPPPVVPP